MSVYRPRVTVNDQTARDVRVSASLAFPWRVAEFVSQNELTEVQISMSNGETESVIFQGFVDDPGAQNWGKGNARARGLPDWREAIGPRGFEDGRLETVLGYIREQCGGKFDLRAKGQIQRAYQMVRAPAYQLVQQALSAWRSGSILVELDGGVLYVGPEADCPQNTLHPLKLEYGQNILKLQQTSLNSWAIEVQLLPDLRLLNRLDIDHPLVSGRVKVVGVTHHHGMKTGTRMEVVRET